MLLTDARRPSLHQLTIGSAFLAAVLGTALLVAGCVHPAKKEAPAPVVTTVSGRVIYADEPNRGLPGAMVRAVGKNVVATTDSTGWFVLTPSVGNGEFLQLSLSKLGFNEVVTTLTVQSGVANSLTSPIALTRTTSSGGGVGGPANSVVLRSISAPSIGVDHAGTVSTTLLTFEVRDAEGQPVNFAHRATIQFTLSQRPGGGAFLTPDTMSTDESGRVAVSLNSGTLAQAVQVRAQVMGSGIYSDIVPVAIHGGLPDAAHFSFAVGKFNIPGLYRLGVLDPITAFVGDRYGNPVPTGTVVYFTTSAGIIQGSATTDDHGRATVDLESAEPLPASLPVLSDSAGLARVSVQTMDQNRLPIVRSSLAVMFSGHSQLQVTPATFNIPVDGAQDFNITLWDVEHHNPLAAGTVITITATQGTLGGEITVTLPDTWDPAYTHFSFRLENPQTGPALVMRNRPVVRLRPIASASALPGGLQLLAAHSPTAVAPAAIAAQPASIRVNVTSPNGDTHTVLSGFLQTP